MTRKTDRTLVDTVCPLGIKQRLRWETWIKKADQHTPMNWRHDDVRISVEQPDEIHRNYKEGRVNYVYWKEFKGRKPNERYLKVATCVDEKKKEGFVTTAHPVPAINDARMYGGEK